MATRELNDLDDAPSILSFLRDRRTAEMRAQADLLQATVAWAAMHSTETLAHAATLPGCEGELAVAGDGAPLVSEFAVYELAAAMGMSSDAGAVYVGDALELAHRLPRLYGLVRSLVLPVWKARRIAQSTKDLPADGAAYVDTQLAGYAHKISFAQLDRSIETARATYDPAEAEARRVAAFDRRHLDIETHQVSFTGCVEVHGTLELADALDLDEALNHRAAELADLDVSHDVRRSLAMGDLARGQLSLRLNAEQPDRPGRPDRPDRPEREVKARQVVLHVHLHDAAIARVENTRTPISVEQVRSWCTNPDTQVVIKPVLDLAGHTHVDAYEFPDVIRERQTLLQHSCVFPHCRRPARRTDCDHIEEAARGGPTCDCNAAPLCRRHHRLKTHSGWHYDKLDATTFRWQSPAGLAYLRDHTGTTQLP
jgi:hypothetical protein